MVKKIISGARLDRVYVQMSNKGRFFNSYISPTSLSDYHYIAVTMSITQNTSYYNYWRFNNRLLQDKSFVEIFIQFWGEWRERKAQYKTVSQGSGSKFGIGPKKSFATRNIVKG